VVVQEVKHAVTREHTHFVQGRDVWWEDALRGQPTEAEVEWVEADHPLFLLYTSGSTGETAVAALTDASSAHIAAAARPPRCNNNNLPALADPLNCHTCGFVRACELDGPNSRGYAAHPPAPPPLSPRSGGQASPRVWCTAPGATWCTPSPPQSTSSTWHQGTSTGEPRHT
jgi:acyl-CoA synthetase (AMP-forming)/AMP-acid ligase II